MEILCIQIQMDNLSITCLCEFMQLTLKQILTYTNICNKTISWHLILKYPRESSYLSSFPFHMD